MPMLPALFMSVPLFARSHGMSERQVLDRLDNADFPEVEKEIDAGKRYVDLIELATRMESGQFKLSDMRKRS